jgi:hypothetical protein
MGAAAGVGVTAAGVGMMAGSAAAVGTGGWWVQTAALWQSVGAGRSTGQYPTAYVADWDDLPPWQQETDADIFERIEQDTNIGR